MICNNTNNYDASFCAKIFINIVFNPPDNAVR